MSWLLRRVSAPVVRRLSASPLAAYRALVAAERLRPDAAQERLLRDLGALQTVVVEEQRARAADAARLARAPAKLRRRPPRTPKGLYVFGAVGSGKSLCCDLFFRGLPVKRKRRVHFHQFMLEVHARLHAASASGKGGARRALRAVGARVAAEADVLVFDEFQVTDVADALVARQLFDACWDAGLVLVATSNRPPDDLYEGGPNREYFEPFVERLKLQCRVRDLDSPVDHRRLRLPERGDDAAPAPVRYVVGDGGVDEAVNAVRAARPELRLSRPRRVGPRLVPAASLGARAAVFAFDDLCGADVGAADYRAVANALDVVGVAGVPKFDLLDHDAARRFITLVDELYEARATVVVVAAAVADDLFPTPERFERARKAAAGRIPGVDRAGGPAVHGRAFSADRPDPVDDAGAEARALELASVRELAWAFRRCASRLTEMAAPGWPASATPWLDE